MFKLLLTLKSVQLIITETEVALEAKMGSCKHDRIALHAFILKNHEQNKNTQGTLNTDSLEKGTHMVCSNYNLLCVVNYWLDHKI